MSEVKGLASLLIQLGITVLPILLSPGVLNRQRANESVKSGRVHIDAKAPSADS